MQRFSALLKIQMIYELHLQSEKGIASKGKRLKFYTLSKPPLTIIFCLSGGTPVRSNSWHLKTYGGWLVSISTAG